MIPSPNLLHAYGKHILLEVTTTVSVANGTSVKDTATIFEQPASNGSDNGDGGGKGRKSSRGTSVEGTAIILKQTASNANGKANRNADGNAGGKANGNDRRIVDERVAASQGDGDLGGNDRRPSGGGDGGGGSTSIDADTTTFLHLTANKGTNSISKSNSKSDANRKEDPLPNGVDTSDHNSGSAASPGLYPDTTICGFIGMTQFPPATSWLLRAVVLSDVTYMYGISGVLPLPAWGPTANVLVRIAAVDSGAGRVVGSESGAATTTRSTVGFGDTFPKTGGGEDVDYCLR